MPSPSTASTSDLAMNIRWEEPGFCVATHDCLVTVVWGRDATMNDILELSKVQRALVDEHSQCAVMSVIRAGLSMSMGEGVREASEKNLREFEPYSRGSAMVVEAGGLRAAFFRSVVTGIQLVARSPVPQKVFDKIDDSVTWLTGLPGLSSRLGSDNERIIAAAYDIADRFGSMN